MKKLILVLILILACSPAFTQQTSVTAFRDANGDIKEVFPTRGLPVDIAGGITVTIGSSTFTASPVYSDAAGTATLGLTDANRRVVVNLGSETIGLKTELSSGSVAVNSSVKANTVEVASGNVSINNSVQANTVAIQKIDHIADFGAAALSVTAGTATAVIMPNLGAGRVVYLYSDQDVNFGGSGIGEGASAPYIPGTAPFISFKFTKADPDFYFRGRTTTATIEIWVAEE